MRIELGSIQRHARHGVASALLLAGAPWFAPDTAMADAVSDWNAIGVTAAVTNAGRPAAAPFIDLAYVHAAIYDAVNAIDRHHSVYAVVPTTPAKGASPEAATAAAAYTTLLGLFPTQQPYLDGVYAASLAAIPAGTAKTLGIAVGSEVGAALLVARSGDGRNAVVPYTFGSGPGVYQLTPGANPAVTPVVPWVAKMVPFAIESASRFRAAGPPELGSAQWAEDFNETKSYGALVGSLRTPEQTEIGQFWLENPAIQASRNIRGIAAAQGLGLADSARYFAETYVTAADALITCWDSKFFFNFWRPVTAIRAGDTDGNEATEADPTWLPLGTTPGHPEYPAAHGCLTGAIAFVAADFFGTKKLDITFTSTSVPGIPLAEHRFTSTEGILREITNARIYGGMHYRTSAEDGVLIARSVSRFVTKHFFLQLDDDRECGRHRSGAAHCRAQKRARSL